MPNEGILEVSLLDVAANAAREPAVKLTVRRGTGPEVVRVFNTSFAPDRKFELPSFPIEHVLAPFIEPSRYRGKPLPPFMLTEGKTVARNVTVFRQPSEWAPRAAGSASSAGKTDFFDLNLDGTFETQLTTPGSTAASKNRLFDLARGQPYVDEWSAGYRARDASQVSFDAVFVRREYRNRTAAV